MQSPTGTGSAIYSVDNIDSYLPVHPKTVAATSGNSWSLLIAVIAAAVVVAGIVAWLLLRRRPKALEEWPVGCSERTARPRSMCILAPRHGRDPSSRARRS